MDFSAWFTLIVICLVMASIISNRVGVDVAMVGGLTLLILGQVVEPRNAISGFADPAVIMIGSLFCTWLHDLWYPHGLTSLFA